MSGGFVYVGASVSRLDALWATNGTVRWSASLLAFHGTPGAGDGLAVVSTDSGSVYAYDAATGRPAWTYRSPTINPFQVATGPAITPDGVYVANAAIESLVDLTPAAGAVRWSASLFNESDAYPAVDRGDALVGTEGGCVWSFGPPGGPHTWPVAGLVVDAAGAGISDASVAAPQGQIAVTTANGSFVLNLTNGTYVLTATASLHDPRSVRVTVAGPVRGLRFALPPLTVYPVSGVVRDGDSYRPLVGAVVELAGPYDYHQTVVTDRAGEFRMAGPNGTDAWLVRPPTGFGSLGGYVVVAGGPAASFLVLVPPLSMQVSPAGPWSAAAWVPLASVGTAAIGVRVWELRRRRVALGLPPALLSPFARYVVMRSLLVPAQVVAILAVLYFFGNVVLLWGTGHSPCGPSATTACVTQQFFGGFGRFAENLFGGNWGVVSIGSLKEPIATFFAWWLPNSIELAAVALALAAILAYPLGLMAGWRRSGPVDSAVRFGAMAGVIAPSFLVALLLLVAVFPAYSAAFGDLPYGFLPSSLWFHAHGGYPAWVGTAQNTLPTGFPIVDAALHGAWAVEAQLVAKTLLQAAVIALVYGAIFLRHARNIAYQSARESHIVAARARAVPESDLLWRHTGRRVLPLYLLLFGLTLPAFVGTQAVVEAMFNDAGVGTLLLIGVTQVQSSPFGVFSDVATTLTQVAFFLLAFAVLVGRLSADVLARYFDPQLLRRET